MTSPATYYTRSGRFGWHALPRVLLLGGPVAVLLAAVYALVIRYNPFIYFSFIATGLFALLLGALAATCAQAGHSRSRAFDVVAGLLLGLVGWWAQWVVWAALMYDDGRETARHLAAATPAQWLDFLQYTSDHLHMSVGRFVALKRDAPHLEPGTLLWIWGIEAFVIIGGSTLVSLAGGAENAYSERTRTWAKVDWQGHLALEGVEPPDAAAWKARLEAEGVAALASLAPAVDRQPTLADPPWHTLELCCKSVADDPAFCVVTVGATTHTPKDKKGRVKVSTSTRSVVTLLMAEPGAYRRLVADLQARAPRAEDEGATAAAA